MSLLLLSGHSLKPGLRLTMAAPSKHHYPFPLRSGSPHSPSQALKDGRPERMGDSLKIAGKVVAEPGLLAHAPGLSMPSPSLSLIPQAFPRPVICARPCAEICSGSGGVTVPLTSKISIQWGRQAPKEIRVTERRGHAEDGGSPCQEVSGTSA